MLTQISFLLMGFVATFLSIMVITRKAPVSAAMLLVVVMLLIAGMYGLLGAHFAAVSQLIVYAGAIMVVFIFVIMLLNIPNKELNYGRVSFFEIILAIFGLIITLSLGTKIGQGYLHLTSIKNHYINSSPYYPAQMHENVKEVAALMFSDYLLAFELISFLIIVAIIGVIVITTKEQNA